MDTSLKYFWGASYGSIYPALSDLVKNGMAVKRDETENNRNKIIYSITQKGRCHLKDWLRLPAEKDELRYETLLKLFFGNEAGALQAISHIDAFEEKLRKICNTSQIRQMSLEKTFRRMIHTNIICLP